MHIGGYIYNAFPEEKNDIIEFIEKNQNDLFVKLLEKRFNDTEENDNKLFEYITIFNKNFNSFDQYEKGSNITIIDKNNEFIKRNITSGDNAIYQLDDNLELIKSQKNIEELIEINKNLSNTYKFYDVANADNRQQKLNDYLFSGKFIANMFKSAHFETLESFNNPDIDYLIKILHGVGGMLSKFKNNILFELIETNDIHTFVNLFMDDLDINVAINDFNHNKIARFRSIYEIYLFIAKKNNFNLKNEIEKVNNSIIESVKNVLMGNKKKITKELSNDEIEKISKLMLSNIVTIKRISNGFNIKFDGKKIKEMTSDKGLFGNYRFEENVSFVSPLINELDVIVKKPYDKYVEDIKKDIKTYYDLFKRLENKYSKDFVIIHIVFYIECYLINNRTLVTEREIMKKFNVESYDINNIEYQKSVETVYYNNKNSTFTTISGDNAGRNGNCLETMVLDFLNFMTGMNYELLPPTTMNIFKEYYKTHYNMHLIRSDYKTINIVIAMFEYLIPRILYAILDNFATALEIILFDGQVIEEEIRKLVDLQLKLGGNFDEFAIQAKEIIESMTEKFKKGRVYNTGKSLKKIVKSFKVDIKDENIIVNTTDLTLKHNGMEVKFYASSLGGHGHAQTEILQYGISAGRIIKSAKNAENTLIYNILTGNISDNKFGFYVFAFDMHALRYGLSMPVVVLRKLVEKQKDKLDNQQKEIINNIYNKMYSPMSPLDDVEFTVIPEWKAIQEAYIKRKKDAIEQENKKLDKQLDTALIKDNEIRQLGAGLIYYKKYMKYKHKYNGLKIKQIK